MNYSTDISPFFVNTIPKSGSHLLRQILLGIPDMKHDWDHHWYFEGYHYQLEEHQKRLQTLKNNECAFGHVYFSNEWYNMINQLAM
ncbi:hypothetical protein KUV80_06520 [Fictibacillus nanhaiensis]|uniref:hypothetical protein n=1 Tax=Fictibacillus nanhaiensis TaxID=742169 RepID=UPI001C970837|nr:hypothetical protein [Fictibacillus nanhaiensis]MBY6036297.1 hypothetical protein [Fictibacillus nanhaiensis]